MSVFDISLRCRHQDGGITASRVRRRTPWSGWMCIRAGRREMVSMTAEVTETKKVTAFVGSGRRKHTDDSVREFLDRLEALGGVETELVRLFDCRLEICRGCQLCFDKGEESCPLKDDRDVLIGKMVASDGVVFASPNYSFQVSGLMKVFLDRLGFVFHRPRFHGKAFTSIVVQGIYGGGRIVKYLDWVGRGLGFDVVKGSCSNSSEALPERERRKRDRAIAKHANRFHEVLHKRADSVPGLVDLAFFRLARARVSAQLDESDRDYRYYQEKGWFVSDYFYSTRLGWVKRVAGSVFDALFRRMSKTRVA